MDVLSGQIKIGKLSIFAELGLGGSQHLIGLAFLSPPTSMFTSIFKLELLWLLTIGVAWVDSEWIKREMPDLDIFGKS